MGSVFANIDFLSKEDGGRSQPIPKTNFGCPVFFEDIPELASHGYDCHLLVSDHEGPICPGDTVKDLEMIFLSSNEVILRLRPGTHFTLWEGKTIAIGEISSVV